MNPPTTRKLDTEGAATADGQSPSSKRQKLDFASPLCEECQTLDIDKAFHDAFEQFQTQARRSTEVRGQDAPPARVHNAPDGSLCFDDAICVHRFGRRLRRESTCPLCGFFREMRVRPDRSQEHKLLAWPSSESWLFWLYGIKDTLARNRECMDKVFMAVVPDSAGLRPEAYDCELMEGEIPTVGVIYRLEVNEPRGASGEALVRPIELDAQVNFSLVSGWLKICREHHGGACERQGTHEPVDRGFRLIDCTADPPVVEVQPWGTPYVALSYVWGTSAEDGVEWPRTVLDAVAATREIGLRYLWVDRLCINQDDGEEKMYLINRMTTIYECADVTLFAVAGSGASHGLPGVGSTRRKSQPRYVLNSGSILVSTMRDPRNDIISSTHWTRGWTYQEGVLSNRRLVFTDDQVYWECNNMAAQESVGIPLFHQPVREENDSGLMRMVDAMLGGVFKGTLYKSAIPGKRQSDEELDGSYQMTYGFAPPGNTDSHAQFRAMDTHIRDYSRRRLTQDTDSLNAFLGIINAYRRLPEFYLLHGLPIWMGRVAGSLPGAQITFALAVSSWYHLGNGSLSTFVVEPCRRRSCFPSWSWAGWDAGEEGAVAWRAPPNFHHAELVGDLIQKGYDDAWPIWAADLHLCNRGWFGDDDRPPTRTVKLRDCEDAKKLDAEKTDLIVLQNPWILNKFHRKLVDNNKSRGSETFMWEKSVGRTGRPRTKTGEGAEWDNKRYRIHQRLSYIGLSVQMTEEEWEAKHRNGEVISVFMFASRYPSEENEGHGIAMFITLRRGLPDGRETKWERWERIGVLNLVMPKWLLDICESEAKLLKVLPIERRESVVIIE